MHGLKLTLYGSVSIIYTLHCSLSVIFPNTSVLHIRKSSGTLSEETCVSSFIQKQPAFSSTTFDYDVN